MGPCLCGDPACGSCYPSGQTPVMCTACGWRGKLCDTATVDVGEYQATACTECGALHIIELEPFEEKEVEIVGVYDAADWYRAVTLDGQVLSPEKSLQVRKHSPDGFAWGYSGSGPAQLALAILLEAGVPEARAVPLYQQFKEQYLAPLFRDSFTLKVNVGRWVNEKEKLLYKR